MLVRMLYALFWMLLLNPVVVSIAFTGVLAHSFPTWTYLLVLSAVLISILWYNIWMWVRAKNIELDDSVRKALGL